MFEPAGRRLLSVLRKERGRPAARELAANRLAQGRGVFQPRVEPAAFGFERKQRRAELGFRDAAERVTGSVRRGGLCRGGKIPCRPDPPGEEIPEKFLAREHT